MDLKKVAALESWQQWLETGGLDFVQTEFGSMNDEQYQTFKAGWLIGFYHALSIGELLQETDAQTQNN